MKRRIISAALVVVMLLLTLVGCGYDFTKKDMAEYASFKDGMDAAKFKDALKHLTVEDADFGNESKGVQRNAKINDYYYLTLQKSKGSEALTEGDFDGNDVIAFTYYATYVKDGKTYFVYPDKTASLVTVKLGYSVPTLNGEDTTISDKGESSEAKDSGAIISDKNIQPLAEKLKEIFGAGITFDGYAYDYKGNIVEYVGEKTSVSVLVSYTKSDANGETSVYYEEIVLNPIDADAAKGDAFLAEKLLAKTDDKGTYSFNTKIDSLVDDKGTKAPEDTTAEGYEDDKAAAEADDVTYKNITVHVATKNTPNTVVSIAYQPKADLTGVKGYAEAENVIGLKEETITIDKETDVTYHIYPVNYYEVDDLTAENILKTSGLTSSLITDNAYAELLEAVSEKAEGEEKSILTKYNEALETYKKDKDAFEAAEKALNGNESASTDAAKNGSKKTFADAVEAAITAAKKDKTDDEKAAIDTIVAIIMTDGAIKADIMNSEAPIDAITAAFEAAKADKDEAGKTAIADVAAKITDDSGVKAAAKTLGDNNKTYNEANEKYNNAETGSKKAYDDAYKALTDKIGTETKDDVTISAEDRIVSAYTKAVEETLIDSYESAMYTNVGNAVWKLILDSVSVDLNNLPKKAVKDVYKRMYEKHEYDFYSSDDNYKKYVKDGGFKQYLIDKTVNTDGKNTTATFADAKAKLENDAKDYVAEIVKVYYVAEALDLELTKDEIKDVKKESAYKQRKTYYGEINVMAAYQSNKLFDYFLEIERDDKDVPVKGEGGKWKYSNVAIETWKEATKDAE